MRVYGSPSMSSRRRGASLRSDEENGLFPWRRGGMGMTGRASRAAHMTIGQMRFGDEGAHRLHAASAAGRASEAAIGLARRARPRHVFGLQGRKDLRLGEDVARTDNQSLFPL